MSGNSWSLSHQSGGGGAGRGSQWQVAIAGFSELNLHDAQTHKQLALSNVDLHVLGCMLEIGKYIPASADYRKVLTSARRSQLNHDLWLYKLVNIGPTSNYLVDQLLKTRAGENVVALLSVAIPIMGEDACVALLSTLFECAGAVPENIPGRTQLESFRQALVPLARKSGFAEKVAHYHSLFNRILQSRAGAHSPYHSIPDAPQIARVIILLHKVVTADEPYVVIWKSIHGAAWVVAYATFVLGMSVCALDPEMNPVPITGSYESAKVVIQLNANDSACELYLAGELQEILRINPSKSFDNRGWSIDCRKINIVDMNHPGLNEKDDFSRLSNFAAIELYNTVYQASSFFEQWTPDALWYRQNAPLYDHKREHKLPLGFKTYIKSVMREVFGRALIVLHDLGFRPAMGGYVFEGNNGELCVGHETDPEVSYSIVQTEGDDHAIDSTFWGRVHARGTGRELKVENKKGRFLQPGEVMRESEQDSYVARLDNYLSVPKTNTYSINSTSSPRSGHAYGSVQLEGYASAHLGDVHYHQVHSRFLDWSKDTRNSIAETIKLAVRVASRLAFTDWHQSCQLLSMNIMSLGYQIEISDDRQFEGLVAEAVSLCFDGVNTRALEKKIWSDDWTALDLDGVIVIRTVARTPDIRDVRGKLVCFASGSIQFEGSSYRKVRSDRSTPTVDHSYQDNKKHELPSASVRYLRDKFPNTRMRPLVTASSDTIFLRAEVYFEGDIPVFVDGTISAKMLPDLLVTERCEHGYRSDFPISAFTANKQYIRHFYEGLYFDDARHGGMTIGDKLNGSPVYVQHTKDNPVLQWLALQWTPRSDSERCIRVLQKDCCLPCILKRLHRILESIDESSAPVLAGGYPICIIAGDDPANSTLRRDRTRKSDASRPTRLDTTHLPDGRHRSASAGTVPDRAPPSPATLFSSTSTSSGAADRTQTSRGHGIGAVKRKPVPSPNRGGRT